MRVNIALNGRMIGVAWCRIGNRYAYIYKINIHTMDGATPREALVALINKFRKYGDLWIRVAEDDPLKNIAEKMGFQKVGVSAVMVRPATPFPGKLSGLIFNRLTPGQGKDLARLYGKIFADSFSRSLSRLYRPLTQEEAEALLMDNHVKAYTVYSSRLAGLLVIGIYGVIGEIHFLGVLPEYRGNGLGKKILMFCLNELNRAGVETVRLEVDLENLPAVMLYRTIDFKDINRYVYYVFSRSNTM